METILGLIMMYVWVHSVVIVGTKVKDTSTYEKAVMLVGISAFILFFIGSV